MNLPFSSVRPRLQQTLMSTSRVFPDFTEQQDLIPHVVAHVLGVDRTIALARRAEAEGGWWSAALRWAVAASAARTLGATDNASDEKLTLRTCIN